VTAATDYVGNVTVLSVGLYLSHSYTVQIIGNKLALNYRADKATVSWISES